MLNVLPIRSADEQCREYVEKERSRKRRAAADRALAGSLNQLAAEHGALVMVGALMRYVGVLLMERAETPCIAVCRGYLLRKISHSVLKHLLTRARILH
jgi:hypothetical protein